MPTLLLAASGAVAAILILYVTRDANFYYDEWDWFASSAHLDGATLFKPDNGHLVLVPRLIYEAVLSVFGTHYLLFQLINVALVITVSVLFFLLARRRVGDWLALVPAVLLMFFGSGWEVLATPVGINANLMVACGLGAFLALERGTLAGDLLAGTLVAAGLASQSGEVAMAAGGTVLLIGQGRWRRIWVLVVPVVLFGIWSLQAEEPPGSNKVTVEHLGGLAHTLFESASAAMASVTGVFPPGFPAGIPGIDISAGEPLAAAALLALGYLLLVGNRPLTPRFFAYATVVGVFWLSIAAVGRDPSVGRYNLVALPFIFLALFELVPVGYRLRWRPWAAIAAVFALGLLANLNALREGAAILRAHGEADSATVAALELQAERVEADPELADEEVYEVAGYTPADPYSSDMIYVTAGDYLRAADEFGSAGFAPAEIATAPEGAREMADRVLLGVLDPQLAQPRAGVAPSGPGCSEVSSTPVVLTIPPDGIVLQASSAPLEIRLRRFAQFSTTAPLVLAAGAEAALMLPGDELAQPWTAELTSAAPGLACPL